MSTLSWQTAIVTLLGVQGLLLSVLLFYNARQAVANYYLSFLIFIYSATVLVNESCRILGHIHPHLKGSTYMLPFLFGPLLYLYVLHFLGLRRSLQKKDLFHFLPFVIGVIVLIPFYALNAVDKVMLLETLRQGDPFVLGYLIGAIPAVHVMIYSGVAYIQTHKKTENLLFKRNWIRSLVLVNTLIWLFISAITFLRAFFPTSGLVVWLYAIIGYVISAFIYVIGYSGWILPRQFPNLAADPISSKKYSKSGLSEKDSHQLYRKLIRYMDLQKPYRNGELTLNNLAGQLGMTSNYLSQVINENRGISFFDFINEYRVVEVKQLLVDNKYRNAIQVAFEAGFNSKSAFYAAFKKKYQVTPAQMRKEQMEKLL